MEYQSKSIEETAKIAEELAQEFKTKGGIIALSGELGAGKTTFVQSFAQVLGIKDKIISPTFVLVRQHQINEERVLYHIDLYRLEDPESIKELGIKEMAEGSNIVLIEWAEKMSGLDIEFDMRLEIKVISDKSREIRVERN